jgi:hypothetical protein
MEETTQSSQKITHWTEDRLSSLVGMNLPIKKEETADFDNTSAVSEPNQSSSDDDFNKSLFADNPADNATKKTLSSNPYAKFLGVALPIAGIFFAVGLIYTLATGGLNKKKTEIVATPVPTPTSPFIKGDETGNLKTEVALGTQAQQINALEESKNKAIAQPQPQITPTSKPIASRPLTTSNISPAPYRRVATAPVVPTPVQVIQRVPPKLAQPRVIQPRFERRISSLPSQPTVQRTVSRIVSRPSPVVRPIQRSNPRLRNTFTPTPLPSVYPTIPTNRNRYALPPAPPGREELVSLLPPENRSPQLQKQRLKSISYGSITYPKSSQSNTTNNNSSSKNSNSNLISNRASEESQEINNLLRETNALRFRAGSYAQGLLATPVFYLDQKGSSGSNTGNGLDNLTYALSLEEGLKGASGDIVIPANSLVIIKATSINNSGLVNLGVVSFIYNDREYQLPSEMFSVRGANNKPLLASKINTGANLTGAEIKEAVFASLAKVGDVLTRTDSTSTISNGGVSTTQTSGGKDIFGAVLSGGFNSILKRESDSTNKLIEANLSRPQLWYVSKGTKASLYVNKSFNL